MAAATLLLGACGASASGNGASRNPAAPEEESNSVAEVAFSADSAYSYVERQVSFGPRVPNTEAHRKCGEWLASGLEAFGATVISQTPTLTAFDSTPLEARNIFARFNPGADERLLLLAHWDCRPWADEDPDPEKRKLPVDGANDGASGVGVLLEIARQLSAEAPRKGVDILLVDAEDWGTEGDDGSWALGAAYFAANPPLEGYSPKEAILLDMVGGKGASFPKEYFSERAAPRLNAEIWEIAASAGLGSLFPSKVESAVTDDHVKLIEAGIPTIDIIEYHPGSGFNPRWHTTSDNMEGISAETLGSVGKVIMTYIRKNY